jgi:hypothetical protein
MIQGYLQKQSHEPTIKTTATPISTSYLNKAVVSLDDIPIGHVIKEENNKMMIITDDNNGNKFIIPSCKVFSVDKRNTNTLTVDIEYHEAAKYKIVE